MFKFNISCTLFLAGLDIIKARLQMKCSTHWYVLRRNLNFIISSYAQKIVSMGVLTQMFCMHVFNEAMVGLNSGGGVWNYKKSRAMGDMQKVKIEAQTVCITQCVSNSASRSFYQCITHSHTQKLTDSNKVACWITITGIGWMDDKGNNL